MLHEDRSLELLTREKQAEYREKQSDIFGRTQRHFRKFVSWFWWHRPTFSPFQKTCKETIKTIVQFQNDKDHISKKWTVFYLAWYEMSNTRRKKNQSTKRSLWQPAQPNLDSAFEQKTRIVSSREISANSQNNFFSYNQRIKPSRAQKDLFGTYSTSFRKVSILLMEQKLFL